MKKNKRDYPWKSPRACLWCLCALVLSVYLTIYMPSSTQSSSRSASTTSTHSHTSHSRTSTQSITQENVEDKTVLQNSTDTINKETEQALEQSSKKSPEPPLEQGLETDSVSSLEQNLAQKSEETSKQDTPEQVTPKKTRTPQTNFDKILVKAKYFAKLFLLVGIAAFIGAIIEARRWHMVLAKLMGKLTNAARLPEIVGLAMPTALFSNAAANTILMNSHSSGELRTSALIAGGMANSYLAYISHSLRVMYPVVATIGLPGILYFSIQFSGGLFLIFCVLLWNRWYINQHPVTPNATITQVNDTSRTEAKPWDKAIVFGFVRACSLIFRMLCITVPLMIGVEYMLKAGVFDFWENAVPESVSTYFKGEMVSIVLAQMGGLIQSSAVSANLRAEGIIDNAQILLAMLIGSAVGNPVRMLRRNLPSALAIFPPKVACIIVLGMQISRFSFTIFASYMLILIMKCMY